MEVYTFIKNCTPYHLTLNDVKNMKEGDTIEVVIWDRNFEEYGIWNSVKEGVSYNPQIFFQCNKHKLTYKGNMIWDIDFNHGETFRHPVHIEHEKNKWRAIDNDGNVYSGCSDCETKKILQHWSEYPGNSRVGWRGPAMLWDKLNGLPQVYWDTACIGNDGKLSSSDKDTSN